MQLTKLLTLSQFVDTLKEVVYSDWKAINYVRAYNDFLKQTLKKEMFINGIEKPLSKNYKGIDSMLFDEDLEAWQEAEKKVIFKGFKISNNSINFNDLLHVFWFDTITQTWNASHGVKRIYDLSLVMSNGELIIQNTEL